LALLEFLGAFREVRMMVSRKQAGSMQGWKRCAWYSFGLFQVIVFLVAAAKPAHAYVDPGSGLLFLQVGGSMLAGSLFVLRAKIRKLLGLSNPTETADHVKDNPVGETGTGSHE
jgi:hypothetical protein